MTRHDYPEDWMGNPDGRNYHYRFPANDEEAWKKLRRASLLGRMIEMFPRKMKDNRIRIDHVTFRTYDKKGYIKGMKEYSHSPSWRKVPHTRGKMEVNNANGGGSRVRVNDYYTGEKWGKVSVEFTVDYTPTEIIDAYENGVNEVAITDSINKARRWAVDDRIDELQEELWQFQNDCEHSHTVKKKGSAPFAYCEDCHNEWQDEMEFQHDYHNDNLTLVGTA